MLQHADAIVREDQCITTQKLALSLSIRKGSISHTIQNPGYSQVCAKCTVDHNTESKAIFSVLLAHFKQMERPYPGLLQQMKPWSIVLNLRQKSQPMEWHRPQSSWKKKFKKSLSAGKARS